MDDYTRVKFCLLNQGDIVAEKVIPLSSLKIIYRQHWLLCKGDHDWFFCLCLNDWVAEYEKDYLWNVAVYDIADR